MTMRTSSFVAILIVAASVAFAQEMPADYASVLKTLGKQGDYKANVLKINIPRNDLRVSIDGSATRVLETAKRNVHRPVKFTSGFRPGPDNYRCRGQDLCRV